MVEKILDIWAHPQIPDGWVVEETSQYLLKIPESQNYLGWKDLKAHPVLFPHLPPAQVSSDPSLEEVRQTSVADKKGKTKSLMEKSDLAMGCCMGLGKKNLWVALRDGGNAGNIWYLVERQKAAKERIRCGAGERNVRNAKGGRAKRMSRMRKGCWSGSSYNYFALLEKCNYRGVWPLVFSLYF